jgi:hypothetical protein
MSMTTSVGHTRRLVIGGTLGLVAVAALGGAALAATEGTGYVDGLALAFSTISTTGFVGPHTGGGLAVTMLVFGAGAVCWFAIIVAAFEIGLRRTGTSIGGNRSTSISEQTWPERLHRRGGGRG